MSTKIKVGRPDFGSMPSFTLSVPRCPKCGEFARGVPVTIAGSAQLYSNDDGKTFEYNGHVKIGDTHAPKVDSNGLSTLVCGGGHRWKSLLTFIGTIDSTATEET